MNTKNTKGKTSSKSQTVIESVKQLEPVVQVAEKKSVKKSIKTVESTEAPIAVPTPVPIVETTPVIVPVQKAGKKSTTKSDSVPNVVQQAEPIDTTNTTKKSSQKSVQKDGASSMIAVVPAKPSVQQSEPVIQQAKSSKKLTKQVEPVVQQASKVVVEVEAGAGSGAGDENDEQLENKLRYFKLIYNDEIQGRYCGKKPKQAANKAFSSIIKDMKKGGIQHGGVNVDINFSIRECTRNSKHKEYKYVGIRETLKEPVKVAIENDDGSVKEIVYNFHNKIQKAPKDQAQAQAQV